jgi:hypothetical protein
MDLAQCLAWNGRRVWMLSSSATLVRRYGQIVNVNLSGIRHGDVNLVVRLDDGPITSLQVSDKGTRWDLAE